MADEADMRNELADLQTRADQIADEVTRPVLPSDWLERCFNLEGSQRSLILIQTGEDGCSHAKHNKPDYRNLTSSQWSYFLSSGDVIFKGGAEGVMTSLTSNHMTEVRFSLSWTRSKLTS